MAAVVGQKNHFFAWTPGANVPPRPFTSSLLSELALIGGQVGTGVGSSQFLLAFVIEC